MAYSTDSDLVSYQPDILNFGISAFTTDHDKAASDIDREIRGKWWRTIGSDADFDSTRLNPDQWNTASVFLVLWKYALPKLTNWVDDDRFEEMIAFYKGLYQDEMAAIFADGVEYDFDNDGVIDESERGKPQSERLDR